MVILFKTQGTLNVSIYKTINKKNSKIKKFKILLKNLLLLLMYIIKSYKINQNTLPYVWAKH